MDHRFFDPVTLTIQICNIRIGLVNLQLNSGQNSDILLFSADPLKRFYTIAEMENSCSTIFRNYLIRTNNFASITQCSRYFSWNLGNLLGNSIFCNIPERIFLLYWYISDFLRQVLTDFDYEDISDLKGKCTK